MKRYLPLFLALTTLSAPVFAAAGDGQENVRLPGVAGTFYASDAALVDEQLEGFLQKARLSRDARPPRLLISPHAGFVYSGQTAAYAYTQLEERHFDTVVLIGPCHRVPFAGASVWSRGAWRTPLGDVPVDEETAGRIRDAHPSFQQDPSAHDREHSLETQIPFLQKTMKDFKIVPIVLNDPSPGNVSRLAAAVVRAVEGKNALIVISTDMSHYLTDADARKMDAPTLELLKKGDVDALRGELAARRSEFCGSAAVLTALEIVKLWNGPLPEVLHYSTSFDATGDASRVVGYGSLAVYEGPAMPPAPAAAEMNAPFTPEQEKFLLGVSRESLKSFLSGNGSFPVIKTNDAAMAEPRAVFVTLKRDGQLRGCLGSLVPREPLLQAVQNTSVRSATQDIRFRKVTFEELKDIHIEISVLSPMKRASAEEIVMGRDGVIIARGERTGVFLPQVATETGWSKEEFLGELCSQKAGLPRDCWMDPETDLFTFTVHSFAEAE